MSLTNTIVTDILNQRFSSQTQWLSLHTSDPTNAGLASSELVATNYSRQQITWDAPSNRGVANSNDVTFAGMPAVTIPFLGVWTAKTGGTLIAVLAASPSYKSPTNGGSIYIPAQTIVVEVI